MSETETAQPEQSMEAIEGRFLDTCRDWGNRVAKMSVRAHALEMERAALDTEMNGATTLARNALMAAGMDPSLIETHIEALLERAFQRTAA